MFRCHVFVLAQRARAAAAEAAALPLSAKEEKLQSQIKRGRPWTEEDGGFEGFVIMRR